MDIERARTGRQPTRKSIPGSTPAKITTRKSESLVGPQICPYCGGHYVPYFQGKSKVSRTCGKPECMIAHRNELHRARYAAIKAARKAASPVPAKKQTLDGICVVCGARYEKMGARRRTCGSANCQTELHRRRASQHYEGLAEERKAERIREGRFELCEICGKPYLYSHPRRRTCSRPKCQRELQRRSVERLRQARRNGETVAMKSPREQVVAAEAPPAIDPNVKVRTCLGCDKPFVSDGPGNRKCPDCSKKKYSEW